MTDGWTDGRTDGHRDGDDVDFEISCSRRSFRPTDRPRAPACLLAHSEKITLSSHSRVLFRFSSPFHSSCSVTTAVERGGITSCDETGSASLVWFPKLSIGRSSALRVNLSVYTKSPTSGKLCFVVYAIYADKPSSSLETEQFRFRFEMAVDRTHSRAFICRRRRRRTPRPTQFRGSDQEGARAQMAPSERSKIVKNTSFMQYIHADRTRISENRRASSEGVQRIAGRAQKGCGASRHHSRAGWMPSFLVWPHSNHVAKVAVSIPNHDFLSLYLGRARTKRPRPMRLLLRQKSSLSHKNPSCPLSLPFFLYSPLCKLLHFDANLIPFLSVSISC